MTAVWTQGSYKNSLNLYNYNIKDISQSPLLRGWFFYSAVKIEGGRGPRSYLYIVKITNFRQTLMSSLRLWIFQSQWIMSLTHFELCAWSLNFLPCNTERTSIKIQLSAPMLHFHTSIYFSLQPQINSGKHITSHFKWLLCFHGRYKLTLFFKRNAAWKVVFLFRNSVDRWTLWCISYCQCSW